MARSLKKNFIFSISSFLLLVLSNQYSIAQILKYQSLPSPINNATSNEAEPSLSANGRIILYSAPMGDYGELKKCISYQQGGKWSVPEIIPQVNTNVKTMYNSGHCLSADGNQIYFSTAKFGGIGLNDIWLSNKIGNTWTSPINLAKPVNSVANDIDPSISADGRTLYFVRTNDKKTTTGKPCGTIWMTQKISKTDWSSPTQLPSPINTGCECNPRILNDQTTFTFASERKGGQGGYDQYIVKLNSNGTWTIPEPLKTVNTKSDDLYISIPAGGSFVYFTAKDSKGSDVVRSNLETDQKPLPSSLLSTKFITPSKNEISNVVVFKNGKSILLYPDYENKYLISLSSKENIEITYSGDYKKYIPQLIKYRNDTIKSYKEQSQSIELISYTSQNPLYHFSTYPNNDYLESALSKNELSIIARIINENPTASFGIEYFSPNSMDTISTNQSITSINIDVVKDVELLQKKLLSTTTKPIKISIKPLEKAYTDSKEYSYNSSNKSIIYLRIIK